MGSTMLSGKWHLAVDERLTRYDGVFDEGSDVAKEARRQHLAAIAGANATRAQRLQLSLSEERERAVCADARLLEPVPKPAEQAALAQSVFACNRANHAQLQRDVLRHVFHGA